MLAWCANVSSMLNYFSLSRVRQAAVGVSIEDASRRESERTRGRSVRAAGVGGQRVAGSAAHMAAVRAAAILLARGEPGRFGLNLPAGWSAAHGCDLLRDETMGQGVRSRTAFVKQNRNPCVERRAENTQSPRTHLMEERK